MGKLTEVEVVLQTVSQEQDATDSVGKGYGKGSQQTLHAVAGHFGQLTRSRSILAAEVAGLVTSQKAGRLGLGSSTTGGGGRRSSPHAPYGQHPERHRSPFPQC